MKAIEAIYKTFDQLTTRELYEILKARAKVFIVNENCSYQDMDNIDYISTHVFYKDSGGNITAYLRLFKRSIDPDTVRMGRVLTVERGVGLGGKILHDGIEIAKNHMNAKKLLIEARKHTIGFYEREGFEVCSDEFLEVGVPHVKMELIF